MVEIVQATKDDFDAMEISFPYRVRAWAGRENGEVLGLGGVMYLPDGTRYAFFNVKDVDRKKYGLAMHRASVMVLKKIKEFGGGRIVATVKEGVPRGKEWLLRLGFSESVVGGKSIFVMKGE